MRIRCVLLAVAVCAFAMFGVLTVHGAEDPAVAPFHHTLSSRALKFYFGVEDHSKVPTYTFGQPLRRTKTTRDVTSSSLQYQLDVLGEEFLLELEANDRLLSPGFHIQYVAGNGSSWLAALPESPCYFGSSANHNDSRAYIGIMGEQLTGFIQYDNVTLVIIPVLEDDYDDVNEISDQQYANPHLIYTIVSDSVQNRVQDNLRLKRNSYEPNYLELAVVADSSMYSHHGEDTREYILMMLNGVAGLYADPSIGVDISIVVSKITILTESDPDLYVDSNSDEALKNFANWMKPKYVEDDTSPMHFDAAALITRVDFYSSEDHNYENTGLGYKWGACDPEFMYSVNEDHGPMALVLTLAHELGHNLGMRHDGNQNECTDSTYIMTGYPVGGSNAVKWSNCSKASIIDFLNSDQSSCLGDYPTSPEVLLLEPNNPPPGLIYGSDEQCQMIYGYDAEDCLEITGQEKCEELKCFDASKSSYCMGDSRPPLDGTSCGYGLWCMAGFCVDKPELEEGEEGFEPDEDEEEFLDESDSWADSDDNVFGGFLDDWDEDEDEWDEGDDGDWDDDMTEQYGDEASPETDVYGNPVNAGEDQYGNPIGQNIDQYGNPIYPAEDQYGNPANEQTDAYGNPINQEQQVDQYGNPIGQEQVDQYGNPISQEQVDQYGNPISQETDIYGNPIAPGQDQNENPAAGVTDQYGNPIVNPETDIYGNPINPEQDQYGNPVNQETDIYGNPVEPGQENPLSPEVDQYGNPIINSGTDQYGNPLNAETDIYGNPINQDQDEYGNPVNQATDVYGNPILPGGDQTGNNEGDEYGRTEEPGPGYHTTQSQLDKFVIGWYAGEFDECSAPCGGGNRTRTVICALHNSTYPIELQEDVCYRDVLEKPPTTEACNEHSCFMTHFLLENDTMKFGTVVIGLAFLVLASLLVFIGIYRRYRPHAFSSRSHKYAQLATDFDGSDI